MSDPIDCPDPVRACPDARDVQPPSAIRGRMTRARKRAVSPRKVGTDERTAETVACLLTATARVLGEVGWHELSTNRVARAAGVSIGTLYRYFPNREALARALIHKLWDDEVEVIRGAANGRSPTPQELLVAYVRHVATLARVYAEWSTHLVYLVAEDAHEWDAMAIEIACHSFDAAYEDDPRKRLVCEVLYVTVIHVVRRAAWSSPELLADGTIEREMLALVDAYLAPFHRRSAAEVDQTSLAPASVTA